MAQFFDIARVKALLEIDAGDTSEDTLLNTLGRGADQTFKNWVLSKQDELPEGDDITDDMLNAVSFKVAARYKAVKNDHELARLWNEEYKTAIQGIRVGIEQPQEREWVLAGRY